MKKFFALLLCLLLMVGMCACGNGGEKPTTDGGEEGDTGTTTKDPGKQLVLATVVKSIGSNWFDSMGWEGENGPKKTTPSTTTSDRHLWTLRHSYSA